MFSIRHAAYFSVTHSESSRHGWLFKEVKSTKTQVERNVEASGLLILK